MGEGRCFGADRALSAKMVDAISTFGEVMKRARALASGANGASSVPVALQGRVALAAINRAKLCVPFIAAGDRNHLKAFEADLAVAESFIRSHQ